MTLNETIVIDYKVYCSVVVGIRDNQNRPLGPHVLFSEIFVCLLRIAILYIHVRNNHAQLVFRQDVTLGHDMVGARHHSLENFCLKMVVNFT